MAHEAIALIVAIVGSVIGATWVLRSKLSDIESKLGIHIAETTAELAVHAAKIVQLEERRQNRRTLK